MFPYVIRKTLYNHEYGVFYETVHNYNQIKNVAYIVKYSNSSLPFTQVKANFPAYIDLQRSLNHDNFINVANSVINDNTLALIFDHHYFVPLYQNLLEQPDKLASFLDFAVQSLSAVNYLHSIGIVHGAINPLSFLQRIDDDMVFLFDLGLMNLLSNSDNRIGFYTEPAFIAPETFEGYQAKFQTDIYTLGHTFYYMLCNKHPLIGKSLKEAENAHFTHNFPRVDTINKNIPKPLAILIQKMTCPHPDDRYEFIDEIIEDLLGMEFVQNYI